MKKRKNIARKNMGKKMRVMVLGTIIALSAIVSTGCSSKLAEQGSFNLQSNSDKKFNKIIVQIDDTEEVVEGFDGEEISKNLTSAFNLPEKDFVKIKVILKQNGKTIANSQEAEFDLTKKNVYSLEFVDVSKDEVELKVKKE